MAESRHPSREGKTPDRQKKNLRKQNLRIDRNHPLPKKKEVLAHPMKSPRDRERSGPRDNRVIQKPKKPTPAQEQTCAAGGKKETAAALCDAKKEKVSLCDKEEEESQPSTRNGPSPATFRGVRYIRTQQTN